MFSPVNLVKRLGVGGRLLPFFKCVCVYFVVSGGEAADAAPSAGAVAAKCAPVLSLLLLVALPLAAGPHRKGAYARRVALGLALSALGDALLLWPQRLLAGMAAFGAAHVAYGCAFGWRGRGAALPGAARLGALLLGAALFQRALAPPPALRGAVALYSALLAAAAWRGVQRGGRAALGALLFVLSDALLGYSLFGGPVPHARLLVMSTYYLAQLAIALSALDA